MEKVRIKIRREYPLYKYYLVGEGNTLKYAGFVTDYGQRSSIFRLTEQELKNAK